MIKRDAQFCKLILMENFATRLTAAWKASPLKKGDIAERLGVALSTVSRWFKGTIPERGTLSDLAALLDVDAEWLLGDEAKSRPPHQRHPERRGGSSESARLKEPRSTYDHKSGDPIDLEDMISQLVAAIPHSTILTVVGDLLDKAEDGDESAQHYARKILDIATHGGKPKS